MATVLPGCQKDKDEPGVDGGPPGSGDTDTDADTDTDIDADSDSDADADADADTDIDAGIDAGEDAGEPCNCNMRNECCDGCHVDPDYCLIGLRCFKSGSNAPENRCEYCDGKTSPRMWVQKPEGSDCGDGVFCNGVDTCNAKGVCKTTDPCPSTDFCKKCNEADQSCLQPATTACNDDNDPMTLDFCDGAGACDHLDYCLDKYPEGCWSIGPSGQDGQCYGIWAALANCVNPGSCLDIDGQGTNVCGQDGHYLDNARALVRSVDLEAEVDSLSGLMWQGDIVRSSTPSGCSGTESNDLGCTYAEANAYCLNYSINIDGTTYTDWRLPTYYELADMVNYGRASPVSDFREEVDDFFWTVSYEPGNQGWVVDMAGGAVELKGIGTFHRVRCVRGQATAEAPGRYVVLPDDQGEDLVLDRATGLAWQRQRAATLKWVESINYCDALSYGGYDDWRLPNISELRSLVDLDSSPVTNFPGTPVPSVRFWSSTTAYQTVENAWFLDFRTVGGNGTIGNTIKEDTLSARCVRGGP